MSKKVEITKIILQMGEVRVELSLSDAEELFHSLEKMFGSKTNYVPYYQPFYTKPYVSPYRNPWWYEPYAGTITCGTAGSGNKWKVEENLNVHNGTLKCDFKSISSAKLLG